jgi:hypothetical protein
MTNNIPGRSDWIAGQCDTSILKNKDKLIHSYVNYMLNRTQQMFEYTGLPESIPQKDLEIILQVNGNAIITKVNGDLYAFSGGLGGEFNAYYLPTIAIVANPYLKFSKNLVIDKECVVMLNDSLYQGLMPLFSKYASLLAETDVSLRFAAINARIPEIVFADNDAVAKSAKDYFDKIESGEELGVIGSKPFFEGIKTADYSSKASATNIKDLIELQQYLKSNWFIDLGLNSNYNMKREAINSSESGMNEDALLPLVDDMLKCRKIGLEKINQMYGTNITVDLSSSWKEVRDSIVNDADTDYENEQEEKTEEVTNDGTENENKGVI